MNSTLPLDDVIDKLVKTLRYEKQQLLSGAYAELSAISNTKSQYLASLDAHVSSLTHDSNLARYAAKIAEVKKLANENEMLLQSAKSGVTAAQIRLNTITNSENMVGTYTQDGDKLRTQDAAITRRKLA